MNFQKYKRALTCLRTLSHACVGLYFCVLYRTVLQSTGAQCISSPGFLEASVKAVIAVAGTALPKHHWIVFSRADGIQSSKEPVPSTSGLSEISLSSACYCWWSISHLPILLQLVTLPACSLDVSPSMPAAVLYYCTFQSTVRSKIFIFVFVHFYV